MLIQSPAARQVIAHPIQFAYRVITGFRRNQGVLLAGAIAYYALLSLIPFLILSVIALSNFIEQDQLFSVLGRYLEWLVPSQSQALLQDVSGFIANRIRIGFMLLCTMLFFSSVAFSVLSKAMSIIFAHHHETAKRNIIVSTLLPYSFVLFLSLILLVTTVTSLVLQSLAQESIVFLGRTWALHGVSGVLFYLLGIGVEILTLLSFYLTMPIGKIRVRHAMIGAVTVALIWDAVRHILVWYFTTLSKASIVYGSLTTAIVALFSMEIGITLLLLGAQVISEYERIETPA